MGLLRFFKIGESKGEDDDGTLRASTTITSTKGQYEGSIIEFDGKLTIGRDPECSELIIDDTNVSRMHCSIMYEAKDKTYIVTDYSTNGTYIGKERIGKGNSKIVSKGTFIIIGQSGNNFRLD